MSLTWRLVRGSRRAEQKCKQKAGRVTVRIEEGWRCGELWVRAAPRDMT